MGSLVRIASGIEGSGPGRSRLTVTELGGHDQLGLIAAVRSRNYDSADTARPIYGAEELYPLDVAAVTTQAGALGPATNNVVFHNNLASSWTPVLELRKSAGTYLTHRGSYRVLARCYSGSGTAVKFRLVWDVGDIVLPVENNLDAKQVPTGAVGGAAQFFWLDLGEVRLDRVPVGTHRWTGQIQAKGAAGGETCGVDQVFLACFDEGFLRLRAPQLSASASVSAYGPRSGGTFADAAGVGTVTWSNPSNAAASDNSYATAALNATTSHYLKATNFGFTIPSGATINGVVVEIEANKSSSGSQVHDVAALLVKGGTIGGSDRSTSASLTGSVDIYATRGGASDLWGNTLTPADVNASGFGVAIAYNETAGVPVNVTVDHIRITIYYTPSTTLAQDAVLFANQSAQLAWDGNFREDLTGTAYGPVSEQIDGLLRLPVAGSENRPVEIAVLTSRGDLMSLADNGPDVISMDGTSAPCHLFPPGS